VTQADTREGEVSVDLQPVTVVRRNLMFVWNVEIAVTRPNRYRQQPKAKFNSYACMCFCGYRSYSEEEKYQSRLSAGRPETNAGSLPTGKPTAVCFND
jgi:hypothetical protein